MSQLLVVLPHTIRHVLMRLAVRPKLGEARAYTDDAIGLPLRKLVAVDVVLLVVATSEVQDGGAERCVSRGFDSCTLLEEGAHGRDACARADHDHGYGGVERKVKI